MEVLIKNAQRLLTLNREALRRRLGIIGQALRSKDDWCSVVLIRGKGMRTLNAQYRGEDETTDVLAFPPPPDSPTLAGVQEEKKAFLGEVVICADEVLRQANAEAVACEVLADRLLVHGLLHLKGYDHGMKAESDRMKKEEERMARLFDEAWLSRRKPENR